MDNRTVQISSSQSDVRLERDKYLIPYLLSLQNISFLGTVTMDGCVYFKFSPTIEVDNAINSYYSRRASLIQPKDLLDNVERFRNELFLAKGGMNKR